MAFYSDNQTTVSQFDTKQASLLEHLERSRNTIALSHFVEWFQGDFLNTIWDQNSLFGVPVFSMVDEIGEGFSIFVPAVNPSVGSITSGNAERQFDPINCIMESVQRSVLVNGRYACGFGNRTDGDLGNTLDESVFVSSSSVETFMQLTNINALLQTGVNTSVGVDQIFHRTILDLSATNSKLKIDGILEATNSLTLPDPLTKLYAGIKIATFAVLEAEVRIKYMEVYNK